MRCLLVALGLIASTCGAFAQEFELPTLRGSAPWTPPPRALGGWDGKWDGKWDGFYVGGQVGYTNAGIDFANNVNDVPAR